MQAEVVQPHGITQYLIPFAVFVVIFALRARRMSRLRPLKIEQLWLVPAIYLVIVAVSFFHQPPTLVGWMGALVGFVVGGMVGWYRGLTTQIHVDPETHQLNQRASVWGMLILVALVAVKMALDAEGRVAHLAVLGNGLLATGLGTFTLMRVEMYLRARRLLDEARAARPA